jgi:hypothetical protein
VGAEVAVANHLHPSLAIADQPLGKGFTGGIAGAIQLHHAPGDQEILEGFPAEFMGELKGLDQSLALQITERAMA